MGSASGGQPIQIVLAADDNYAMPLAVAMCSAVANVAAGSRIAFSVVHNGISDENRARIARSVGSVARAEFTINWLDAPLAVFSDLKITHPWISSLTFVRLLVPNLLPPDVEKAIYLDCDVAVLDDIGALWDLDISNWALMAAQDLIGWVNDPSAGIANYRELGIPGNRKYFNAGVLLLNLRKWRAENIPERLLKYLRDYKDVIRASDQEALNAVLGASWCELDYRWNWQIIARIYRIGTHKMGWTPSETRRSIIHFHSSEKPWLPGCDYEEKRYFFEYLDRTEWAGWRVPWHKEAAGRLVRPVQDLRNSLGRLRRLVGAKFDWFAKS